MKRYVILLLLPLLAAAQPVLTLAANATSFSPGSAVTMTVSMSGATNALGSPTNAQFQIVSSGGLTINAQGVTAPVANKLPICYNRDVNTMFCVVIGLTSTTVNELPLANGLMVTIPATVNGGTPAGTITLTMSQTDGTAPDQTDTITLDSPVGVANGGTLALQITGGGPNPCDLNGDGTINGIDMVLAATALAQSNPGQIAWPLTLLNVARVGQASLTGKCLVQ